MKFLVKGANSVVLQRNILYIENGDNKPLRNLLREEQKNFCAYSEKYIEGLDSVEVEHFRPRANEGADDYWNCYAVLQKMNQHKIGTFKNHKDADFFANRFFQIPGEFEKRINYRDGIYIEASKDDTIARDFIDYLGFNAEMLYDQRRDHIIRLFDIFDKGNYTRQEVLNYFRKHPAELDFITAIEIELGLDLSEFYN